MYTRFIIGILLSAVFLGLGCQTATEPITGRPQFIMVSPDQERNMGRQAWEQLLEEKEESDKDEYKEAVRRVGEHLTSAVDQEYSGFDWQFRVFDSDQANAFCLPGGRIGVYNGLFEHLDNDAELAVVLAHEIAHAVARHGAERMTQAMLVSLGALGVEAATRGEREQRREQWLLAYAGLSTVGYLLPYSREHEYAADHLGMIFMAQAGYDPEAAITFWQNFADDPQPGEDILQYLSTHPVGSRRVQELRNILPRAREKYEQSEQRGLGEIYDWDN